MSGPKHKEELNNVLAKANNCLEDAEYLFNGKRYEAAVNRAYYAMFTAIQGLLLDHDVFAKTHTGAKSNSTNSFLSRDYYLLNLGKFWKMHLC